MSIMAIENHHAVVNMMPLHGRCGVKAGKDRVGLLLKGIVGPSMLVEKKSVTIRELVLELTYINIMIQTSHQH